MKRKKPKDTVLTLTLARVELLSMALTAQRFELGRMLRLQGGNPHMNERERYEIAQTKKQLAVNAELQAEVDFLTTKLEE